LWAFEIEDFSFSYIILVGYLNKFNNQPSGGCLNIKTREQSRSRLHLFIGQIDDLKRQHCQELKAIEERYASERQEQREKHQEVLDRERTKAADDTETHKKAAAALSATILRQDEEAILEASSARLCFSCIFHTLLVNAENTHKLLVGATCNSLALAAEPVHLVVS